MYVFCHNLLSLLLPPLLQTLYGRTENKGNHLVIVRAQRAEGKTTLGR